MAYRRRTTSSRRRSTSRSSVRRSPARRTYGRRTTGRASRGRASGGTIRLVIEQPAASGVARPLSLMNQVETAPQKAKF